MLRESDLGRSSDPLPPFAGLTPAERLVAAHVVEGLSSKEIATCLSRSEATVKNQIGSILSKTGVPTRARFIARYYQQFFCVLASAPAPSADPIAPPGRTAANLHSREARHAPPAGGTRSLREATPLVHRSFTVLCKTAAG